MFRLTAACSSLPWSGLHCVLHYSLPRDWFPTSSSSSHSGTPKHVFLWSGKYSIFLLFYYAEWLISFCITTLRVFPMDAVPIYSRRWLKTTETVSQFSRSEVWNQGVSKAKFSPMFWRRFLASPLPSLWWGQAFLGVPWFLAASLISASFFTWPSLSLTNILVTEFRAHLSNPNGFISGSLRPIFWQAITQPITQSV